MLSASMRVARRAAFTAPRAMARQQPSSIVGLRSSIRFYSEEPSKKQPEESKQQAPQQTESLLTEDILEKAGMDTEGGRASEDQKKKWAGTAKKSTDQSSTDIKREQRSNWGYVLMLGFAAGAATWFGRDWDDEEERKRHADVPEGYSPAAIWGRLSGRVSDVFNHFNEPIFEKLLPDPLPEPYGRPMTLVIGLEDVLLHSEWTREHGWRTAKRPGMDYFLGYLAQYYEIVVFSNNYMVNAEKAVAKMDPYRAYISNALFREASRYSNGKIIKDLSHLNRDLSKVILIDCDKDAFSLQPENAVELQPWKGTAGDKELVRLIPFLEWIAASNVKDIRPILKSYENTNVPDEYARREAIARKQFEEDFKRQYSQGGGSWALKVLGLASKEPPVPKMPQDLIREQGQKGYQEFQKYIQEHGEKMLEEEKQREQEILNEQKFTLNKLVTEGMPKPEEIAAMQQQKEAERQQQQQQEPSSK